MNAQQDRATLFRALHQGPSPLLLANIWDAGSARLVERLGAAAIATTSAGLAWSLGHADGGGLPPDKLLSAVENIARVVTRPLSIDVEDGYGDDPQAVAGLVLRLARIGAAGINIEDGAAAPALLAAKIRAIREALAADGLDLFINARTDVYLRGLTGPQGLVAEVLARGALYRDAGADGLFVPGQVAEAEVRATADGVNLPLNLLARPGLPAAGTLAGWGVRRLSAGSSLPERLWRETARIAGTFLADGASDPLCADAEPYGTINAVLS